MYINCVRKYSNFAAPSPVDNIWYASTSYNDVNVTWSPSTGGCDELVYNVTRRLLLRDQCDDSEAESIQFTITPERSIAYDDMIANSIYEITVTPVAHDIEAENDTVLVLNTNETGIFYVEYPLLISETSNSVL